MHGITLWSLGFSAYLPFPFTPLASFYRLPPPPTPPHPRTTVSLLKGLFPLAWNIVSNFFNGPACADKSGPGTSHNDALLMSLRCPGKEGSSSVFEALWTSLRTLQFWNIKESSCRRGLSSLWRGVGKSDKDFLILTIHPTGRWSNHPWNVYSQTENFSLHLIQLVLEKTVTSLPYSVVYLISFWSRCPHHSRYLRFYNRHRFVMSNPLEVTRLRKKTCLRACSFWKRNRWFFAGQYRN